MSEIRVNFDSLATGRAGIASTHAKLVSTLTDLEANLQPMLQTWEGEAREAYFECKKQWDTAADQMANTLNQIGVAVGNANANYGAAEKSVKGNWS